MAGVAAAATASASASASAGASAMHVYTSTRPARTCAHMHHARTHLEEEDYYYCARTHMSRLARACHF